MFVLVSFNHLEVFGILARGWGGGGMGVDIKEMTVVIIVHLREGGGEFVDWYHLGCKDTELANVTFVWRYLSKYDSQLTWCL